MQSVSSNAVAEVMEIVYVSGKTDPGGNFRDSNNNTFEVSQYSYAQLLNTSGANGYIMIPYKNAGQSEAQSTWAVYNLASHSWVTNVNNLTAIFKK